MVDEDEISDGSWLEWRRLILHEIKRLNITQEETSKTIILLQKDITRLNLWATIWGAVGGIAATLLLQATLG